MPNHDGGGKRSAREEALRAAFGPVLEADNGTSPLPRFLLAARRLPRYARLAAGLLRDERVPGASKTLIAAGALYVLSPVDLIPGVIPVAGQLDDLFIVLLALRQGIWSCPSWIAADHLQRAGITPDDLESDIAAVQDTTRWLAAKGLRAAARLAAATGRLVSGGSRSRLRASVRRATASST